jgi:predicted DNA-binding transcriptional regulator YafY
MAALKLAMGAVRLEGIAAAETLRKLGAGAGDDSPVALASVPTPPVIAEIHAAINEHRLIEFTYNDELRTVEPQRLEFQRGRWYLQGHDRLRDDRRSFRVDRIEGGLTSGDPESFTRREGMPTGIRFDPWKYGDDEPVTAVVRIDASQARLSRGHVGEDAVWTDLPDGSAEVEMEVTNRRAFRTFVLGFLDHAEVLRPPELRGEMAAWLEAML